MEIFPEAPLLSPMEMMHSLSTTQHILVLNNNIPDSAEQKEHSVNDGFGGEL